MKTLQKDYELYILIIILVWDLMIILTNLITRIYSVFFFFILMSSYMDFPT
jgi:hypothetical protein